jgi:hypothetical protein
MFCADEIRFMSAYEAERQERDRVEYATRQKAEDIRATGLFEPLEAQGWHFAEEFGANVLRAAALAIDAGAVGEVQHLNRTLRVRANDRGAINLVTLPDSSTPLAWRYTPRAAQAAE